MVDTLARMQTSPRRYHHGDLRAALLTRAEETLRERGPAALSLRELARDLGVSHAAPSRHFKDKQALLDALALDGFERLAATAEASQEGLGDGFAERLRALVHAYVSFASANAELLDLMYSTKHDPDASKALVAVAFRWSDHAISLIEYGQRRGEVRQGPVMGVALPVFAALHGYADLAATGMLPPGTADEEPEQGLDEVLEFILRGAAPDPAEA